MDFKSYVKSYVRAIAPPLLWNAVKSFKNKSRLFADWEAAASAAGKYSDNIVNEFRIARTTLRRSKNLPPSLPVPILECPVYSLSMLLPKPITIVDFGGATGEYGEVIVKAIPNVSYIVVENENLVGLMPRIENVRFTNEMPTAYDVFFSSCAIQYLSDPYAILDLAFQSARLAVVLSRNDFSERQIFRAQKSSLFENGSGEIPNGYKNVPITYPHQTISEKKIRTLAEKNDFILVSRTADGRGAFPFQDEVYGSQLAFLKRGSFPG